MKHKPIWLLGELTSELCDKAVEEFKLLPPKDAVMGEDGSIANPNRKAIVRFVNSVHWLYPDMISFGQIANRECEWDYDLTGHENIQFAEYAIGHHYNWHVDNFSLGYQKTDRKITVIILLSDPAEYEGGDLLVKLYQNYKPELKKGSVIAFPSILEHMVTPVTKGTRYSATMWINGPCFR